MTYCVNLSDIFLGFNPHNLNTSTLRTVLMSDTLAPHSPASVVKFMPPNSCRVDLSFFETLYEMKLNEMKLAVSEVPISAPLDPRAGQLVLRADSLRDKASSDPLAQFRGVLKNVNTTNEFIALDKPALLSGVATSVWDRIVSGQVVQSPNSLFDFVFLSFADLKQYRFTYWLGFPAFVAAIPFRHHISPQLLAFSLHAAGGPEQEEGYVQVGTSSASGGRTSTSDSNGSDDGGSDGVVDVDRPMLSTKCLQEVHAWSQGEHSQAVFAVLVSTSPTPEEPRVCSLAEAWSALREADESSKTEVVFCVKDVHGASQLATKAAEEGGEAEAVYTPGWGVRNVLAFLAHSLPGASEGSERVVRVLCVQGQTPPSTKPRGGQQGRACFPLLTVVLPAGCLGKSTGGDMPRVVGWQANERGKPGPRVLDAAIIMDTRRVMEQAVDLNVRLMKWRLWPSLDTAMLSSTKCLLLGAGTLGCAVARTLMGWGVRDITFVDNGRVSYSNPARQSLFEFKDCEEKAYKSEAAARRLQAIFPGMRAQGLVMTIPMPGHRAASEKESEFLKGETKKLDDLVQAHDVVFALTDSREARWLPTVQCAAHDKLLINSALGFDSYLVMRHGHGGPELAARETNGGERLGCYFCMDVIGPGNSQRDRTLDQQCTVTRPGLAQIASGLAVELMVALLHSPLRQRTPALCPAGISGAEGESSEENDVKAGGCEPLPHQIRGVLDRFTQVNPVCPSFQHCTACSPAIVNKYWPGASSEGEEGGGSSFADFVEEVCNDPGGLLESLSGVTGLIAGLDELDLDLDLDLSESDDEDL